MKGLGFRDTIRRTLEIGYLISPPTLQELALLNPDPETLQKASSTAQAIGVGSQRFRQTPATNLEWQIQGPSVAKVACISIEFRV